MKKRILALVLNFVFLLSQFTMFAASPITANAAGTLVTAVAPSGTGTQADPYIIESAGNLQWMSEQIPAYPAADQYGFEDTYFRQTCDIDLGGMYITGIGTYTNYTGSTTQSSFCGEYDGGGYSIKNGSIEPRYDANEPNRSWGYALFGAIYGATIKNITLDNISVTSLGACAGMIVGYAAGNADGSSTDQFNIIRNCHIKSNCSFTTRLPANRTDFTASNYSTVTSCVIGTVCAVAEATTIEYCTSDVSFAFNKNFHIIGGIVGQAGYNSTIDHCVFGGTITMNDNTTKNTTNIGGIIGSSYPTTSQSFVPALKRNGYLHITNCYNKGSFSYTAGTPGGWNLTLGGITGTFTWMQDIEQRTAAPTDSETPFYYVENCYNLTAFAPHGNLLLSDGTNHGRFWCAGLVGKGLCSSGAAQGTAWLKNCASVEVTECGFDYNSPSTVSVGTNEYRNEPKQSKYGFYGIEPVGDTVKTLTADEIKVYTDQIDADIAGYAEGATCVIAVAPSGTGTQSDPYIIANAGNLQWISEQIPASGPTASGYYFEDKYFKQICDIDLRGNYITSIGSYVNVKASGIALAFCGEYDGDGFTIKNGAIRKRHTSSESNKSWGTGLFGAIYGATIKNVTLDNIDAICDASSGMIVGYAAGKADGTSTVGFNKITNCHVTDSCTFTLEPSDTTVRTSKNYYDIMLNSAGIICGVAESAEISYCTSAVSFDTHNMCNVIGGVVGSAGYDTVIDHCVFTGKINYVNSYTATTKAFVGGILGSNWPLHDHITNYGTVMETKLAGLKITNCYNAGQLTFSGTVAPPTHLAFGGIIGMYGYSLTTENRTVAPTENEIPNNYTENCYNLTALAPEGLCVGKNVFYTAGIVGCGISRTSYKYDTMWLKNCASVDVTENGMDGSVAAGTNEYRPTQYKSQLGFYSVEAISNVRTLTANEIKTYTDEIDADIEAFGESLGGITFKPHYVNAKYLGECYFMDDKLTSFPNTIETEFKITKTEAANNGYILGNLTYNVEANAYSRQPYFALRVLASGKIKIHYQDSNDVNKSDYFVFDVDVATGQWTKLAIVFDDATGYVKCYVNGVLKDSILFYNHAEDAIVHTPFTIGGTGITMSESGYFKGELRKLVMYADSRTASEVAGDLTGAPDTSDRYLLAAYNTSADRQGKDVEDLSNNGNTLKYQNYNMTEAEKEAAIGGRGDYDYAIAVVGDMHDYDNAYDSLKWLANNAENHKIKYVIQTGDVTDEDTDAEWTRAKAALSVLEGNVEYSIVRGNHDFYEATGKFDENSGTNINEYFANYAPYVDQFKNHGGFYEEGSVANTWREIVIDENIKYLLVNLDYGPNDSVLNWANDVIASHPNHRAIITTHCYLNVDGTTVDANDVGAPSQLDTDANNGDGIWEKLVRKHKNIEMIISGHLMYDDIVMNQITGDHGNTVTQLLVNQQQPNSRIREGVISMMYFSNGGKDVVFETFATKTESYFKEVNQFKFSTDNKENIRANNHWEGGVIAPSGSGTKDDPYIVENGGNLLWMSNQIPRTLQQYDHYFEDTYFKQVCDIDLNGYHIPSIGYYLDYRWATDTTKKSAAFAGEYDGNGFTIKNGAFTAYYTDAVKDNRNTTLSHDFSYTWAGAMFGAIYGATIKNVTLDNVDVMSTGVTGGLVGIASAPNDGTATEGFNVISNCHLTNTCDIMMRLPNKYYSEIVASPSAVSSTYGGWTAGGGTVGTVVGSAIATTIEYCTSDVELVIPDNWYRAGGIVGIAGYKTVIDHCEFTGKLTLGVNKITKTLTHNIGGILAAVFPQTGGAETVKSDLYGLTDSKGTLKITNCINKGEFVWANSASPTFNVVYGGIAGFLGWYAVDGATDDTRPDYTTDLSTYSHIENCHNLVNNTAHNGLLDSTGNAVRYWWYGGLVGKGLASASKKQESFWLKNCSSIDVDEHDTGSNSGAAYNTNEYRNEGGPSSYGFYGIEPVLDAEGNSTVKTLTADVIASTYTDAIEADIAAANHKHSFTVKSDAQNHWQECSCGEILFVEEHIYDNHKDTTCNECDNVREATDCNFVTKYNASFHWTACDCGDTTERVAHNYQYECSTDCLDCDYVREAQHSNVIKTDGTNVWYECKHCHTASEKTALTAPLFNVAFSDDVIPNTALLIDKTVSTDVHVANWDGTDYTFINGINAFASLANAADYAKEQGIESPHFILLDLDGYKGDTEYNTFCATIPGNYYTQNWNKMPYTKGEAEDGSDWASNIGSGAGKFDTSKGIRIKYFSFKQAEGVGAGAYKFYGFTITSTIEDINRTAATPIDVLFENTYFNKLSGSNSFYCAANSSNTASPNASKDKFEFKNMYYVWTGGYSALMDGKALWATTIFDGFFADFAGTSYPNDVRNVKHNATDSTLIIRNSNIRNFAPTTEHITYTGLGAATGAAGTRILTLDNNIFYNYYFHTTSAFMKVPVAYLSEFNFTNNKVYNVSGTDTKLFTTTGTGNGVNEDLKITITGNYLSGFDCNVAVEDRNIAASSAVSTNYLASTYAAEQTQTGKPLNIQGLGTTNYYLDSAMTKLSGNVYGMTLNEQAFDEDKGSYSVTVPATTNKVNLNDYIVNDYNVLTAYSDEAMTISADITALEIAPAGSVYYVKVASNDLASVQSRTVSIIREDGFAVGNEGLGSSFNKTENEVTYNWLSWRGSVNATGSLSFAGGTEMEHRVGVIYFSELTKVEDLKAAIVNEFTQNGGTLETADAVIDSVNASVVGTENITAKAYVMSANKTLTWDSVSQSYGYRYNFSVPDEYKRGAIMFAVYEGEDGLEVIFSDMVVQKS